MSDREHTNPAIPLIEGAKVKTTLRVLFAIVVGAFALGGTLYMLRADIAENSKRIDSVDSRLTKRIDAQELRSSVDHDILIEIRADVKALNRDLRKMRDDPKN